MTTTPVKRCPSVSPQGLTCQKEIGHKGEHCALRASGLAFEDDATPRRRFHFLDVMFEIGVPPSSQKG